jgi:hypothetical protein
VHDWSDFIDKTKKGKKTEGKGGGVEKSEGKGRKRVEKRTKECGLGKGRKDEPTWIRTRT